MLSVPALVELEVLDSVPTSLLINGQWRSAATRKTFEIEDPATNKVLRSIADAGVEDAAAALDSAAAAQESWAKTSFRERGKILRRAFELVAERADSFALLLTLETGKPLHEALEEVAYAADLLFWFAAEANLAIDPYSISHGANSWLRVGKKPVGPCLLITPWTAPLAVAIRTIAPAVAAGCTVILKPAHLTPLTSVLIGAVFQEAGLPPGVLNVIATTTSSATTGLLIKDPRLRKLSFTGSTEVGRRLLADASNPFLRISMNLGGNAPFVVFEDADLDAAVVGAMAANRNRGEACAVANKYIVHESVVTDFAEKLAARVKDSIAGRGTRLESTAGPFINAKSRDTAHELVTDAVDSGATVLVGGAYLDGPGYFFQPTLLRDVTEGAPILSTEIIGPVAAITAFQSEEEAARLANNAGCGLRGYVFTKDMNRGIRMCKRLEVKVLSLNDAFTSDGVVPSGAYKRPVLGSVGDNEYLRTQYIDVEDPCAT